MTYVFVTFIQVVITIKTTSASDTLSWHSVKGISTDDLHTLTEAAIFKIFAHPQSEHDVFNSAVVTANLSSKQSFVRGDSFVAFILVLNMVVLVV